MNRRDLILGGALGLAAAGAARAQTSRGSGGLYVPACYGQVTEVAFTTSTDLQGFMPPGLTVLDPHRAFLKFERVKIRSPEADKMTAAFNEYDHVCIATMATTPQFGPRQRNILMWEHRAWTAGGPEQGVQRWVDVGFPDIFDIDHNIVAKGGKVAFNAKVWRGLNELMSFSGAFDGKKRVEHQPYPGFYVGGDPGRDLEVWNLEASEFSRPLHGTGTLRFGAVPTVARRVAPGGTPPGDQSGPPGPGKNWAATVLKDIEVQGAVHHDFSFTPSRSNEFQLVRKALPGDGRSRL